MLPSVSSHLHRSIIKAQEDERMRVAREIHDGPAQIMANVALRLDVCQKLISRDPSRVREELLQLRDLLKLGLQDARKLIADLRPMALDDVGLVPTLADLVADAGDTGGFAAFFHVTGHVQRLDSALEIALFRVCQEALSNVSKHAMAKTVRVEIAYTVADVTLTINDDGRGFAIADLPELLQGTRFGMVGMNERAQLFGGYCNVESRPNEGTCVTFTVPLPLEGESHGDS